MKEFKAYAISRLGEVKYIGVTTSTIVRRWQQHVWQSKKTDTVLVRAINKYGPEAFSIEHIASAWDRDSLNDLERLLIRQYGTCGRGYNATDGGRLGMSCTPETREKMRLAAKRRWSDNAERAAQRERLIAHNGREGVRETHQARGKAQWADAEQRAQAAERAKERFSSVAERRRQSERVQTFFTSPRGEAARSKLSERAREQFADPETRAAMSQRGKEQFASDEARKRAGEIAKAALARPEVRAQMSAAAKARWERLDQREILAAQLIKAREARKARRHGYALDMEP